MSWKCIIRHFKQRQKCSKVFFIILKNITEKDKSQKAFLYKMKKEKKKYH